MEKESQWLTNMLDKLPFVTATAPSSINLGVEFAHLIPGHAKGLQQNASYIDDFESTQNGIDLRQPSYWMLASTPLPSFPKQPAAMISVTERTGHCWRGTILTDFLPAVTLH